MVTMQLLVQVHVFYWDVNKYTFIRNCHKIFTVPVLKLIATIFDFRYFAQAH